MPNKLVNMKIHEVSAVDKAANGRKFLIMKRDYSQVEREEMATNGEALPDGSYPIKDITDLENAIQAYGRAKDKEKTKKHIIARAKALGAEDKLPEIWRGGEVNKMADETNLKDKLFEFVRSLFTSDEFTPKQKQVNNQTEDKGDESVPNSEGVVKSVSIPEEITKRMEDLEKRNKELEEQIKKAADEAKTKEFIAKAASFDKLGIKADELGPVLKSIAEVNPEGYAKIESVLKAANEQIAKGALFAEAGIDGGGESDIVKRVEAQAKEIQKRDGCSIEKARAKVYKENPELYAEYQKEMFGGR